MQRPDACSSRDGSCELLVGRSSSNLREDPIVFYVPEPLIVFIAQGYQPSAARLVSLLLEELGIRVEED